MIARPRRPAWMEQPNRLNLAAKAIFLAFVVVGLLYPLLNILATSISSPRDINFEGQRVGFHPTLLAYEFLLGRGLVFHALLVSIGITAVGTAATMIVTTALAYALTRPFQGNRALLLLVAISFLVPANFIPTYLVVRALGLLNNYASLILPVLVNSLGVIVIRQFIIIAIPPDLGEAARLDGATEFQVMMRVVLPMSKAVIAVIALFTAADYWNAYLGAVLYLDSSTMWPLTLIFRAGGGGGPGSFGAATTVISALPIFCLYPFLHRFFAAGPLSGAGAVQYAGPTRREVQEAKRQAQERAAHTLTPAAVQEGHMIPNDEADFQSMLPKLRGYRRDDLDERFRQVAETMVLPALEGLAQRLSAEGHECRIDSFLERPIPAGGQAVYFTFDTRYAPGERSLCIRLPPGESMVQIDRPLRGMLTSEHLPLTSLKPEVVQRLALYYVRAAIE